MKGRWFLSGPLIDRFATMHGSPSLKRAARLLELGQLPGETVVFDPVTNRAYLDADLTPVPKLPPLAQAPALRSRKKV